MLSIKEDATLDRVLRSFPVSQLCNLLRERRSMLGDDLPLEALCHFIIVQAGDRLEDVEKEAGIGLTFDDGSPTWEWVDNHGFCYEAPIILTDDGFGVVLLIQTGELDPALQRLIDQCV